MSNDPMPDGEFPLPPPRFGAFRERPLARILMDRGDIAAPDLLAALGTAERIGAPLDQVLLDGGPSQRRTVLEALAIQHGATVLSPAQTPPDPRLAGALDPVFCLENGLLPWVRSGGVTLVACARPERFLHVRDRVRQQLGPVRLAIAAEADIQAVIARRHAEELAQAAETWVPDDESCRDFNRLTPLRAVLAVAFGLAALMALALAPDLFLVTITVAALVSLILAQGLKAAALAAGHLSRPIPVSRAPTQFPKVSLLVPLLHETDIAGMLVQRLGALSYPRAQLEVLLILESGDMQTRTALDAAELPAWMRVISVPPGTVTTKPRALNYAYRFCTGDIIGIYDAEDAPAPDQIERIVARFEGAPDDVACLQGILDFYNPRANWLSRCFTIEYATWFRVLLPGLARLGFAIPLGGTTVFFRRKALETVRGWDAHNVTEDADLGIRLARHGFRTEVVATVTHEEANNRVWPWIRQRSRWLKGYIITYLVHMRRPARLWRELGARRFVGVQLIFLTAILQFTLAPALWSFWLVMLGLGHPVFDWMPQGLMAASVWLFVASEGIAMLAAFAAVAHTPHVKLMLWVPTMMLYFPLGVIAAYKAWWEMAARPFFWDKTAHGHSLTPAPALQTRSTERESSLSRVTKATEIWSRKAL